MLPFVMFGIKVSSIQSLVPCVVTSLRPSPPAHPPTPPNIGGSEGGEWEARERDSRCVEREVMVGNS